MKKFMKKNKNTIIFVGIIVIILAVLIVLSTCLSKKTLKEITYDEYTKLVEKGEDFVIYFGEENQSYNNIKEIISNSDATSYFVNTKNLTDEQREKLYASDKYFAEEEWGTPLNLLYKDGKRIDVLNGYVDENELISFLQKNKVIK